jgi:hypothetical protein
VPLHALLPFFATLSPQKKLLTMPRKHAEREATQLNVCIHNQRQMGDTIRQLLAQGPTNNQQIALTRKRLTNAAVNKIKRKSAIG